MLPITLMNRLPPSICLAAARRFGFPANPLAGTIAVLMLGLLMLQTGCFNARTQTLFNASTILRLSGADNIVEVEKIDNSAPTLRWKNWFQSVEPPSPRTMLLLRQYDLEATYQKSPEQVIRWLHQLTQQQPSLEDVHALAELAEKRARWCQRQGENESSTRLYTTAIIHAYQFLFDSGIDIARNAYDPQFRSICDIYNRSLTGLLRTALTNDDFGDGFEVSLGTDQHGVELKVQIDGRWQGQQFDRFELVDDYRISGFANEHRTYGLGVPLIAVRRSETELNQTPSENIESYYPPELTVPMTAFLHLPEEMQQTRRHQGQTSDDLQASPQRVRQAVLSLYDPLEKTSVKTGGVMVPLESDITTPLAFGLQDPLLNKGLLATASFLDPEFAPDAYGIFMIEPYDPSKIPVVMVHGLWDGPSTWAHMINDLRAVPEIHDNYQFWFYSYPTSRPFWIAAGQLRTDLKAVRESLDPASNNPNMDDMVLVGHSMGGLLSLLQTIESGNRFWAAISDHAFEHLQGKQQAIESVRNMFFFHPNQHISRVVTIATPFGGSDFANFATRWIGRHIVSLPAIVSNDVEKLARDNRSILKDPAFLTNMTSIDSLAPSNPMFQAINRSSSGENIQLHNIVGRLGQPSVFGQPSDKSAADGDGVVSVASASVRAATSSVFVAAEHSKIHQNPGCILRVRQVLLKHLAEIDRISDRPLPPKIQTEIERPAIESATDKPVY